jgi:hypothetical protein
MVDRFDVVCLASFQPIGIEVSGRDLIKAFDVATGAERLEVFQLSLVTHQSFASPSLGD